MLILLAAAAALSCKVEAARYALRTAPQVTAEFHDVASGPDWPSGVAFAIHLGADGRTQWFLPWAGGTDGLQHLASTTEVTRPGWSPPSPDGGPRPLGDLDYIATDAAYAVLDDIPRRGAAAPAHILLPELDDRLRRDPSGPRTGAPTQFFDLTGCAPDR